MKHLIQLFMVLVFLILTCVYSTQNESNFQLSKFKAKLSISNALREHPDGTLPRREMETKLVVEGAPELLKNNSFLLETMKKSIEGALTNEIQWFAPKYFNSTYTISPIGLGTFCFLDIYLDSPDFINERLNISHRVRYRWHSRGAFLKYMLGSDAPQNFPHRCEYQVKTDRDEKVEGFYCSNETRFEFRNESFPFKRDNSAPLPPWSFEEFILPAIHGRFRGYFSTSAFEYARFLSRVEPNRSEIELSPSLLLVMTRRRIHLNLPTALGETGSALGLGSPTNINQAMIVTLDTSEVFSPELLNLYSFTRAIKKRNLLTKRLLKRLKGEFLPLGTFTEIEFEFERNIESALHKEMNSPQSASILDKLRDTESAFLKDEKLVSSIVSESLRSLGLQVFPTDTSKYRKGCSILRNPNSHQSVLLLPKRYNQ
ncbi:hypothetical protein HYY75_04250 [bacterium]|nr:hypothetical protein [bacterium]